MSDKKRPQGRPPNQHGPNKSYGFRPRPELREAFDAFVDGQEVAVTHAAVIAAALEEFLRKRGFLGKPDDK